MGLISLLSLLSMLFFVTVLLCIEAGRRIGRRDRRIAAGETVPGLGPVDASIFGLLGLLIAFTFSGAAERLDARRTLIVDEANAIGTAWLRIDLLPPEHAEALRPVFRQYVDRRIEYYEDVFDRDRRSAGESTLSNIQATLWGQIVAAVQAMPAPALGGPVLQATNEMFDIATTRNRALERHPPYIVYAMLVVLALVSALLIGFGMAGADKRPWLHSLSYALVMTTTLYVIVDFELPRAGAIRVDAFDTVIVRIRQSF